MPRRSFQQPASTRSRALPPRGGATASCPSTSRSIRQLGRSIVTDSKRLQQVLKNLLSNAFKFTETRRRAASRLRCRSAAGAPTTRCLSKAPAVVAFEVSDTGIGIPPEKQKIIFEAFQQADASTSRKYGGTGLGLAISRELANLLGGEIQLRSTPGKGSTFTLYLPLKYVGPVGVRVAPMPPRQRDEPRATIAAAGARRSSRLPDDRDDLEPGDMVLLIVEDDPHYARVLVDLAHDNGFKVLVAATRRRRPGARQRLSTRPPFRSTCSCPTCSAGPC